MDAGLAGPGSRAGCILAFKLWGVLLVFMFAQYNPARSLRLWFPLFCAHLPDSEGLSPGGERDGPPGRVVSVGSGLGAPRHGLALAYL